MLEQRFQQRLERLKKYCGQMIRSKPNTTEQLFPIFELFHFKEANIFSCATPKTGSSLFHGFMAKLFYKNNRKVSDEQHKVNTKTQHRIKFEFSKNQCSSQCQVDVDQGTIGTAFIMLV